MHRLLHHEAHLEGEHLRHLSTYIGRELARIKTHHQ